MDRVERTIVWTTTTIIGVVSLLTHATGCSPRGGLGDPCSYNPDCQPGLFCDSGACAEFTDDGTDAGEDSGTDAATGTDSGSDAAQCDCAPLDFRACTTPWPCETPGYEACDQSGCKWSGKCDPPPGIAEADYPAIGHCYRLDTASVADWSGAVANCATLGADWHLVTIADDMESSVAWGTTTGTAVSSAWIGLQNDGATCAFSWITGEPVTFTPWGSSQPDQCGGTFSCGQFWGGPTWGDAPCSDAFAFICERF